MDGSPDPRAVLGKRLYEEAIGIELAESGTDAFEDRYASFSTKEAKALRQFLIWYLGYAQMSDYLDELSGQAVDITRKPSESRLLALATDCVPERFESC